MVALGLRVWVRLRVELDEPVGVWERLGDWLALEEDVGVVACERDTDEEADPDWLVV